MSCSPRMQQGGFWFAAVYAHKCHTERPTEPEQREGLIITPPPPKKEGGGVVFFLVILTSLEDLGLNRRCLWSKASSRLAFFVRESGNSNPFLHFNSTI